jgi:hypothetical protein
MIRILIIAVALVSASPASAMPDFVPKPSEVYQGYVALEMPRTELPVGALWVQNYGPSGDGAAADNLVTERSLSQITINSDLQLGLTAGILNLFGLDPSYRNKLSARFGDLSIVRVKDMAKLSGPASEPRIYEAVRAGSVTITTDNDIGLDIDTRAAGRNLPVVGRSDNGRRRSFSMDGKDMFIAFRVASQEEVKSEGDRTTVKKGADGWEAKVEGRLVKLDFNPSACASPLSSDLRAELRVPVADGKGGLYERASVRIAALETSGTKFCDGSAHAIEAVVQLLGRRLQTFAAPKAPRW